MKRINIKYLVIFFIPILLLTSIAGCVEISTPTTEAPPIPAPAPALPPPPINPSWTPPPEIPSYTDNQTLMLPNIAAVVALVKPSVVTIDTEVVTLDFFNRPFTQKGAGSGWIIDENGIIVTNNHVIEGASTISVTMDDGSIYTVDADSIYTDRLNDIAILRIDAENLPALNIGDSSKLRVGDWVVAIGNSLGLGISAKQGIVSRQGVSIPVSQGQTLYDLVETSAAINQGNSGGPLVNLTGEVIGITSAKIATIGVEGMGYAISMETAMPIIQELVNKGYVVRPWLGVGLRTVDERLAQRYDLAVDKGILITQVTPDSPASAAGLLAGDIIVSVGGEEIITVVELIRILHTSEIGQRIEITFWREDTRNTTAAVLAESPPAP